MNGNKIRAVTLAALMLFSVVAVATPAAAATTSEVSVNGPSSVSEGEEVTYDIQLDTVDNGAGSVDIEVGLSDNAALNIESVSQEVGAGVGVTEDVASDGNSATITGSVGGISGSAPLTVATVTVSGAAADSSSDITATVNEIGDQDGNPYTITGTNPATVSVTASDNPNEGFTGGLAGPTHTAGPTETGGYSDAQGNNYWQGQVITVEDSALSGGNDVAVYERIDADTTQLQTEVSADDGSVSVDTEDFTAGNYFLYATTPGVDFGINRSEAKNNEDLTFGVTEQTLSATFDDETRTDEGQNSVSDDFEFESNRAAYPINVTTSSGNLDAQQLADIFVAGSSFDFVTSNVEGDDDEITIDLGPDGNVVDRDDYVVDFQQADIDPGEYEFVFSGTDSTAEDTDTITINEANQEAEFAEGTSQTAAGDIAEFNVTLEDTDDTYIQIGNANSDFVDVLYLKADDNDEPINVEINTRVLGTNVPVTTAYNPSNEDVIESAIHGGISEENLPGEDASDDSIGLFENDGNTFAEGSFEANFEAYLDEMDIIELEDGDNKYDQLIRPVQPTEYEVVAGGFNSIDNGVFDADADGEANDELGSKVIELTQPEIGEITTHTAPEEDADDETDVPDLVETATARDEIAAGDQLIIQVEATGIYGAMVAQGNQLDDAGDPDGTFNDFDRLSDGMRTQVIQNVENLASEQVTIEAVATDNTGNQESLEIDLTGSDSDTYALLDEENGQFFIVADTSSDDAFANGDAPSSDTDFDVTVEYDADNGADRHEFDAEAGPFTLADGAGAASSFANYPYLQQGETISNSATFSISPRSLVFDNLNDNQVIEVAASESGEVSGTTNVAPGSDATLRVDSSDASSSFRQGNDLNITADGSVTTTFDLSGQEVGDEFDITYQVAGSNADTAEGVLVESVGTDEEETNETDTGDEEMDDGETEPADDGETNESTGDDGDTADDGSTDDGTPGFGAVVALIALIGAALLAVRRQN